MRYISLALEKMALEGSIISVVEPISATSLNEELRARVDFILAIATIKHLWNK